jgi:hypothetical protein
MGSDCHRIERWQECCLFGEGACHRGVAYAGVPYYCSSSGLPWWRGDEGGDAEPGGQLLLLRVRPPFLLGGCFRGVLPHLNGHGGGLGRRSVLWCWWRDLEASRDLASCALPMRQPRPAAAIQGHKVGRAVLDDDEIARSYFPVREDLVQSCSGNN